MQAIGRKKLASDPDCLRRWEAGVAAGKGGDLSVILYTSGTTGRSKGVMLTYGNTIVSARNANAFDRLDATEEVIAYLPLAWVGDYIFSYVQAYAAGYCVNCPETPDTVVAGPARNRHDLRVRAPAGLRKSADADDGAHGGCRRAQAQSCSISSSPSQALGRENSRRREGAAAASACSTPSAIFWSTARSKISSAFRASASATPRAKRSARNCFASIAASV